MLPRPLNHSAGEHASAGPQKPVTDAALPFYETVPISPKPPKNQARWLDERFQEWWKQTLGFRRLTHDFELSEQAFRLWHFLYHHKDRDGVTRGFWSLQETICGLFDCERKAVARWIRELVSRGWLKVSRPKPRGPYEYATLDGFNKLAAGNMFAAQKKDFANQEAQKLLGLGPMSSVRPPMDGASKPVRPPMDGASHIGKGYSGKGEGLSPVKLPPAERIDRSKELAEIDGSLKRLRESYDSHTEWSAADRDYAKQLKARRAELREMLGYADIQRSA